MDDPLKTPRKILLVADDCSDTREMYARLFYRAGFLTIEAHSGELAVSVARFHLPDVIVLDVLFDGGGITGVTAVRLLRQDAATRGIPIVLVSGYDLGDDAAKSHVEAVVMKPVIPEILVDVVQELVAGRLLRVPPGEMT